MSSMDVKFITEDHQAPAFKALVTLVETSGGVEIRVAGTAIGYLSNKSKELHLVQCKNLLRDKVMNAGDSGYIHIFWD